MKKIKVGFLGSGFIASVHSSILQEDERVEITGVADIVLDNARKLAESLEGNVQAVETLDELIALGVDTVYVTTPNTTHVEPVVKCLKADLNVFSEKPMAVTEEGAERILAAAKGSKGVYNLGMNRRYANTHKKVKEWIEEGTLNPHLGQFKLNRGELLKPAWTADSNKTGGFLYETTIHQIDLLPYFFGPVKTIRCEARQNISDNEFDDFAVLVTFENGGIATLVSSAHSGWSFPFETIEIYGKYSTATTAELETVRLSPGLEQQMIAEDYTQVPFYEKGGYIEEDRLFIDALINNTAPPVDVDDAYQLTMLINAIYESAETGEEIDFASRVKALKEA